MLGALNQGPGRVSGTYRHLKVCIIYLRGEGRVCGHRYTPTTSMHVKITGQLTKISSLLLPCGFWGFELRSSGLSTSIFAL